MQESKSFSFIREYKQGDETLWEYFCSIIFNNERKINKLTITDHYKSNHDSSINNDLICHLLLQIEGRRVRSSKYPFREVYVEEFVLNEEKYRLIFWFKDETDNHLWIRNCYRID